MDKREAGKREARKKGIGWFKSDGLSQKIEQQLSLEVGSLGAAAGDTGLLRIVKV